MVAHLGPAQPARADLGRGELLSLEALYQGRLRRRGGLDLPDLRLQVRLGRERCIQRGFLASLLRLPCALERGELRLKVSQFGALGDQLLLLDLGLCACILEGSTTVAQVLLLDLERLPERGDLVGQGLVTVADGEQISDLVGGIVEGLRGEDHLQQ